MTTEQNKANVKRFVEQILNTGQLDRMGEFFTPDFVDHARTPGYPPGIEGTKQFFGELRAAFPDFHYTVDDSIADGDKVVQRATGHGTMKGPFQGMPATGKHAMWSEIHTVRYGPSGKILEHWASIDQLGMLQQLGLAPTPGQ
ncbi:MAG: ester cyclase [Chloroflexi bacterium]|nr:ester cyclase [Chloroflexota bacterium]